MAMWKSPLENLVRRYKYHPRVWRIKRFFHYHFGKCSFKMQIGDYYEVIDANRYPERLLDASKMMKEHVPETCYAGRYSPASGKIDVIIQGNIHDPLTHLTTFAWKMNVVVHTKKSWKKYLQGVIGNTIKYKKNY